MSAHFVKCLECKQDKFPNQLNSNGICQVCQSIKRTVGEMVEEKREPARSTAWQHGRGWAV